MIVLDTGALIAFTRASHGSEAYARLQGALAAAAPGNRLGVPAPVLAEYLVRAGAAEQDTLDLLQGSYRTRILSFDAVAAVACAKLDQAHVGTNNKRGVQIGEPYQKIKVDRQIVAIAQVHNASLLIANDDGLRRLAISQGLHAVHVRELPIPREHAQRSLDLAPGAPLQP